MSKRHPPTYMLHMPHYRPLTYHTVVNWTMWRIICIFTACNGSYVLKVSYYTYVKTNLPFHDLISHPFTLSWPLRDQTVSLGERYKPKTLFTNSCVSQWAPSPSFRLYSGATYRTGVQRDTQLLVTSVSGFYLLTTEHIVYKDDTSNQLTTALLLFPSQLVFMPWLMTELSPYRPKWLREPLVAHNNLGSYGLWYDIVYRTNTWTSVG